jgi:two-component system, sensor histidine kinase
MDNKRSKTLRRNRAIDVAHMRALQRDNASLKKTVEALIARVEQGLSEHKEGFAIFETAVQLEETVSLRTAQLEALNKQLTRELTLRQEIEAALKSAKLEADHANQVKSRFLAAASHDLRQPLSSAFLFLESLDDQELSSSNRDFVRKAKIALSSVNDLLRSLLDITKLEVGGIKPGICNFRVEDVLTKIFSEYTHVAVGAGLGFRCISSSAVVRTDPRLLESVLRNFVSNAIRYTPAGKVLVGCRRRKQGLEIAVHDTGIGIPQSELENIFQAYHQCESATGRRETGMGLGLSIVQRIVTLLRVERYVRSVQGRGSVFSVIVPYGRRPVRTNSTREELVKRTSLGGKVIVIVDDNRDVLDAMAGLLRKWDCVPVPARDATEALVQLMSNGLVPDLIIADYHLGDGRKGSQAIRDISREFERVSPAFVMTSDPDPVLRHRLKRSGLGVLTKPLNLAKLRAMIDQKLAGAGSDAAPNHGILHSVPILR